MATRKNASKKEVKASFNFSTDNTKITKKQKNSVKKQIKKLNLSSIILILLFLILGLSLGIGAYHLTCKDDCFEIIGKDEITLTLADNEKYYTDEGVKIISFSKDISSQAIVETNLLKNENGYYADEIGTYYIKYSSLDIKYGKIFKVEKIRLITYVEEKEEDINVE